MRLGELKIRLAWKTKKAIYLLIGLIPFFILKVFRRARITNLQIGFLNIDRIGHFLHAELFLRQCVRDNLNIKKILFISCKPVNQQLYRMIKRRMRIVTNDFLFNILKTVYSISGNSSVWIDSPFERRYELINHVAPQLQFSEEEEREGKNLLDTLGIKQGIPFVCFNVRDSAYLEKMHSTIVPLGGWAYHDYRDCNIKNYLDAVDYLVSLGFFAIRMGYIVGQKLESNAERVIDYATKYRTDFGDVYLSAKCKFFLASEGGLNSVPWIFDVPVAYANIAPPFGSVAFNKHDVFMPKKLWNKSQKRFLTFHEILSKKIDQWYRGEQYAQAGIEVVENSPEEILGLVKEINSRIDGSWIESEEDKALQERYRRVIPEGHRCYGHPARICSDFLRKNIFLLEESLVRV